MSGCVYAAKNQENPGIIKIGCTTKPVPYSRVKKLSVQGVCDWELIHWIPVENAFKSESHFHSIWSSKNVKKEFFTVSVDEVIFEFDKYLAEHPFVQSSLSSANGTNVEKVSTLPIKRKFSETGLVYAVWCPNRPGQIKFGYTTQTLEKRLNGLNHSGVVDSWEPVAAINVKNPHEVEKNILQMFVGSTVRNEIKKCSLQKAMDVLLQYLQEHPESSDEGVRDSFVRYLPDSIDQETMIMESSETFPMHVFQCPHGMSGASCPHCNPTAFCEHGRHKEVCVECHGSLICVHDKIKIKCPDCTPGSYMCVHAVRKKTCRQCNPRMYCLHGRFKYHCKDCGGSHVCIHSKIKYQCKECKGKGICIHGRARTQCKECKGGSICTHDRQRTKCKECKGGGICVHNIRRSECKLCRGGSVCHHDRRRSTCKECQGSEICPHNRRKQLCKECKGGSICQHNRQRYVCKECKGNGICAHDRILSRCKDCKGGSICEHGRVRCRCKECKEKVPVSNDSE